MDKALILSTGRGSMDLLYPTPEQVNIGDMLINLSRIRRWCGASVVSVLRHQMMVAEALEDAGHDGETILAGLTHDLHEYVTGDIPAPLLDTLLVDTGDYLIKLADLQADVQRAIDARLGITGRADCLDAVNVADMEARQLERGSKIAWHGSARYVIDWYRDKLEKYGVNIGSAGEVNHA